MLKYHSIGVLMKYTAIMIFDLPNLVPRSSPLLSIVRANVELFFNENSVDFLHLN